jgi:magnesium transporter
MLLDLKFSISTLAITAGTFVAALYGMNLKNFIEESDFGFYGISAWCAVFGVIVATYGLQKLRKVQRLSMYGHHPNSVSRSGNGWGLGAWGGRSIAPPGGGAGFGRKDAVQGALPDGSGAVKKGETLADVMLRERALARKLARVEAKADDLTKH